MRSPRVVGTVPTDKSPYGVMDGAGNVMEWVDDWYAERYFEEALGTEPPSPDSRCISGASWGRLCDHRSRYSHHQPEQDGCGLSR